ncbi:MAG TPA: TIGR02147 family protein [Fibrobacteres bacterium]|jgi:uncharacterized protein (TIGR02147 family)|nr:TIGR02147 family protein [Fibrobacterota bacterium]
MQNISDYSEYRQFLQDYYNEAKARNPGYSYQIFAIKIGLKSKGFLFNVLHGKRSISRANIFSISQAMKFNGHEMEYFENLVGLNQAKSIREQAYYFEHLTSIKNSGPKAWKPQIVRNEQFEFYSKIHHSIIRSLIGMFGLKNDYKNLAKKIYPKTTPGQVKKSVELLEKLGFIKKNKNGSYILTNTTISTPPEIVSLAVNNFHRQTGELAIQALCEIPGDKRNISGVTLGISKDTYKIICEEIQVFRSRLMQIAEADHNAEEVYQLNFQFFPLSKNTV